MEIIIKMRQTSVSCYMHRGTFTKVETISQKKKKLQNNQC